PALTRCWGLLDEERRPRRGETRGEEDCSSSNPCSSSSKPRRSNKSKVRSRKIRTLKRTGTTKSEVNMKSI
ncbi:hypothetical protein Taro_017059, partial [Colocasia esculenta]|nr:hypothetical protein [Colocasia esculenta]